MLLVTNLANTKCCKKTKNDWNPCKWVLIWKHSTRAFLWIPTWLGYDDFHNFLHCCELDKNYLSIRRVKASCFLYLSELVPEELSDEADEISMVDQSFHKGPRTRRQKERRQREKEVDIVEKKSKGRRRVVMMVDSSSEDDVKSPNHKMDVDDLQVSVMKKMDTKPSATNCDISNTGNIQDSRRNSKGIETKGGHVSKPVSQPSTQPSLLSRCKKLTSTTTRHWHAERCTRPRAPTTYAWQFVPWRAPYHNPQTWVFNDIGALCTVM